MMTLPFTIFPGTSAQDSLSRQTEGAICPGHMALARAWDAAHPLGGHPVAGHPVPAPAAVRIVNIRPSRDVALTLLCDAMYRAITTTGCVTDEDLARTGLSPAHIAELAPAATAELASAMAEYVHVATAVTGLDDRAAGRGVAA